MKRDHYLQEIENQLRVQPVCALLGPRQVGKTTLAGQYAQEHFPNDSAFFDLENPVDLARLENPMLAFASITETLIVIDEIQLRPDLFPILRVLVDRPDNKHKFLILGSVSRDLTKQSSESLAGRIGYIELPPFSFFEVHDSAKLQIRGGFPKSYLASSDKDSYTWRQNYVRTFLERDIPALGFNIPALQMRRFWTMLAHYHGQTLNLSEIARSLMISDSVVKKYLDILAGTFMIRLLPAWFENISKRQVRASKLYFCDIGILNFLLGISNKHELQTNPKLGALWEGFALEEVTRFLDVSVEEAFFWSTQAGAELDLLVIKDGKRLGFEFKYSDAPTTTKSMHSALRDLNLNRFVVIYPGDQMYQLTKDIVVCGLNDLVNNKLKL